MDQIWSLFKHQSATFNCASIYVIPSIVCIWCQHTLVLKYGKRWRQYLRAEMSERRWDGSWLSTLRSHISVLNIYYYDRLGLGLGLGLYGLVHNIGGPAVRYLSASHSRTWYRYSFSPLSLNVAVYRDVARNWWLGVLKPITHPAPPSPPLPSSALPFPSFPSRPLLSLPWKGGSGVVPPKHFLSSTSMPYVSFSTFSENEYGFL